MIMSCLTPETAVYNHPSILNKCAAVARSKHMQQFSLGMLQ